MKYIRILLVFLLMLISVPVYAEDEKPEEEINFDVLFSELLDSNDYEYIMNEINSIKEINHYFYNEISSENLLRFRVLELESKMNRENHEDYPITRINQKENTRNLTKSSINYNFDGFVGGVLKQGVGVNYDTEFRYIYDGDGRLRMSGHQLNGTHVMNNGYSYWGADGGSEWRFPTDTNRIVEWIPNYGTYLGIPVGREMIIEILDRAGSVSFGSVNLGGTNPSIYLENAKQVAISLRFYKDVDRNNHMTNGNLINLNSDADVILYGADGLTNQSSENGTQEYFGPENDSIPLYSRQNPNDIGTDNINGRTIYYNKVDKQNIKIFADVKGLSEAKAIFGIRGDFNRDPTMHFYVGLDIYKGTYPNNVIGYVLNVDPSGGEYSGKPTYEGKEGDVVDIPVPKKTNHRFTGWQIIKGAGTLGNNNFTFAGSDATIKANYELAEFKITYILNGGTNHKDNPNKYVTGNKIIIKDATRNAYEFLGWKEGNVIGENATGDKTFTANWKAIEYPIKYDLYGNYPEDNNLAYNHKDNPNKYTIEDEINILNPNRDNYEFVGWKEGNKINKGSSGEKLFTAIWKPIIYNIEYDLYGNHLEEENIPINNELNPYTYTTVDEINILDPSRKHYNFIEWKEGNKIEKGSSGDKFFTALWELIKYPITYILNGGENHPDNPNEYTYFDEIEIDSAKRKGYTFAGWKEGDYIPLHSEGEQFKTAKWDIIHYDIDYDLDGGENNPDNPNTYTIEDEIDILDPTKEGYEFIGWKEGNKIEKGSTGRKKFTALWKAIIYNIDYELEGGENNPNNPNSYTIEDEIDILDPKRPGFIFDGWKPINKIEKGSTGDKVFRASWIKINYVVVDTKVK